MSDMSQNNDLVDWPHVEAGVFLTLEKSDNLFSDAKFLYDSKKLQNSNKDRIRIFNYFLGIIFF